MNHLVLLGDSMFDNRGYIGSAAPVIEKLRMRLSDVWIATLLAEDGGLTRDVIDQLANVPEEATHIIISTGASDALMAINILAEPIDSMSEALAKLASMREQFERDYRRMLASALMLGHPTAVCTISHPSLKDLTMQRIAVTVLTVFNDCIIRMAFQGGLPLLDLRMVCSEPSDFANGIEPSATGGEKIAAAIVHLINESGFSQRRTTVYS